MKNKKTARFGMLAVAALLGMAAQPGGRVAAMSKAARLPSAGITESPSGRIAAGLGVRKVFADWKLIEIMQYCADESFGREHGAKLPVMAARMADFDPKFAYGFMFNGSMLMWQCHLPIEAAALLERGISYNPAETKLKLYLAAFTYTQLNDLANEVKVLERLAFAPDAPFMLRRILSNAYAKQGKISRAAAICRLVLETSVDMSERRWAETKLGQYRQLRDKR